VPEAHTQAERYERLSVTVAWYLLKTMTSQQVDMTIVFTHRVYVLSKVVAYAFLALTMSTDVVQHTFTR
jgi:hypothetical protein